MPHVGDVHNPLHVVADVAQILLQHILHDVGAEVPYVGIAETGYRRGDRAAIERFQHELQRLGVNATIRRELGADISAACGQLRRQDAARE